MSERQYRDLAMKQGDASRLNNGQLPTYNPMVGMVVTISPSL